MNRLCIYYIRSIRNKRKTDIKYRYLSLYYVNNTARINTPKPMILFLMNRLELFEEIHQYNSWLLLRNQIECEEK